MLQPQLQVRLLVILVDGNEKPLILQKISVKTKKVRNLQKQLLESKKNVKLFKTLFENLKHTYGISPFTGKLNRNVGDKNCILVTDFSMSLTSIYHFRTNSNENKILLFGESRRGR